VAWIVSLALEIRTPRVKEGWVLAREKKILGVVERYREGFLNINKKINYKTHSEIATRI
jgi:hypothetical protein